MHWGDVAIGENAQHGAIDTSPAPRAKRKQCGVVWFSSTAQAILQESFGLDKRYL